MPAAFCWFLAWRYLVTRWVTLLGMLGVAVAVWALIVVISIFSGFIEGYRENIEAASPPLLLTSLAEDSSYEELAAELAKDPNVVATAPRILHYAMLYPRRQGVRFLQKTETLNTNPSNLHYVQLLGIDPDAERKTSTLHTALENPASGLRQTEISGKDYTIPKGTNPFRISPARYKKQLDRLVRSSYEPVSRLHDDPIVRDIAGIVLTPNQMFRQDDWILPGQRIDLVSARFAKVDGKQKLLKIRNPIHVSGAFETDYALIDNFVALIHIDDLREMLGIDPMLDVDLVTEVAIRVKDEDLSAAAARLRERIHKAFPTQKGSSVQTWEEQNAVYLGAINQERAMMTLVLYVVMLVAGTLIYATLLMMVTQKTKDIGILTSMGATPGGISWLFVLSGTAVGLVGNLLGGAAGILSVIYMNPISDKFDEWFGFRLFPKRLFNLEGIPHRLEADWILMVMGSALLLSLLLSFFPARRAAKLAPVLALKHE